MKRRQGGRDGVGSGAGTLTCALGLGVAMATAASALRAEPAWQPALQQALERAAATLPDSPGLTVLVRAPRRGIDWQAAVGRADPSGAPLTPKHPFRVASITKIFVGAAILRLEEDGRLLLDQPVAALLAAPTTAALRGAGYDPDRITVRQLMDHTSGLRDFFDDPAYEAAQRTEPNRRWSRAEQIAIAMRLGPPLHAPGERFHYGDTAYILLGEILERAAGQPLGPALRRLLAYSRHGLRSTWLESLEPAPAGALPRAHQLAAGIDTTRADPSHDLYGGGGLVSTLDDVARLFRALLQGRVLRTPAALASGLTLVPAQAGAGHTHLARPALFTPQAVGPHACLGMGGYYGTVVVHCPAIDLTIGFNANTSDPRSFDAAGEFMSTVGRALGTAPSMAPRR